MAITEQEVTLEDAFNIGIGHMQQSNYRVAEMVFQDILKANPDHHNSHYMISLAKYFTGDVKGAISHIEKAVAAEDAEAEWWCNYGILLNEEHRYDDAIAAYDKAIEINPDFANSYWNKSHTFWLAQRYEEAEASALKGTELDPKVAEAWLNLGTAQVKLDKKEEAIKSWEKVLGINPDFVFALNNMGNVLRELGQLEAAIEKCRRALELDPEFAQAMNNLATALLDKGEFEEAEEWYRKAILRQPDYVEAHNNLSIALIRQNRIEEAIVEARYAVSFNPSYAEGYINLSGAYKALGNMKEAERAIQKASVLKPDSVEVRVDLADILFMQDRYGDAEIELENARNLSPDTPRVHLKLASVLERGNKIEEALEAVKKAVELNPEMPEAHLLAGNICYVSNQTEDALKHFNKTLELRPDHPAALISLAELYMSLGELDKVGAYIDKVKEDHPEQPALYHTLSKSKSFTEDDPDFQKMVEMGKESDRMSLEHASALNFALFSAYEDIKDYPKAFEHLIKGNDYKRQHIPYDKERQADGHEKMMGTYTKDYLKELSGNGYESDLPVFIVGMPRSATTLTEQLISSHPDVFGAGELMEISMTDFEFGPLNAGNAKKRGQWYVEQVKARDPSGKALRVTDKMPGNFASLGKIISMLPDAKIIHTRRNPIDTCLSCFKQSFARGQYWSYNLEELGDYYNMYLELMAHWRDVMGDRFIEIDYEDTVNDLEPQARKLIDYVGLPWNDACLEPHKQKRAVLTASKMQVIKPVYKTSVKAWERYGEQLQPLIDSLSKGPAKELLDL